MSYGYTHYKPHFLTIIGERGGVVANSSTKINDANLFGRMYVNSVAYNQNMYLSKHNMN